VWLLVAALLSARGNFFAFLRQLHIERERAWYTVALWWQLPVVCIT